MTPEEKEQQRKTLSSTASKRLTFPMSSEALSFALYYSSIGKNPLNIIFTLTLILLS